MRRWLLVIGVVGLPLVPQAQEEPGVAILPPVDLPERARIIADTAQSLGIPATQVEPEQLVQPEAFNAQTHLVAFYVGFERYVQTVQKERDGDEALRRYLKQGGTLVSVGQTFPFYRPLTVKQGQLQAGEPEGFCRRLGLMIQMGFEEPKGKVQFRRAKEPPLFGFLPETMPFAAGDPRFRAATGEGLPEGSTFTPILTLHDAASGEEIGVGVALIEHEGEALGRGKVVYVWGNMLTDELTRQMTEDILVFAFGGRLTEEQERQKEELERAGQAQLRRVARLRTDLGKLADRGVEVLFLKRAVEDADRQLAHVQRIVAVGRLGLAEERVEAIEGELGLVEERARVLREEVRP